VDKIARLNAIQDDLIRHGSPQMSLFNDEQKLASLAAQYLADERVDPLYAHPGLCLTVLPHRETPAGMVWERVTNYASLLVHPLQGHDGRVRGVPYGSKARLILLYLMTEAVKARSRTVELGRSMHAWMSAMGVPPAGKNYRTVADQADRIEHCILSFRLAGQEGELTVKDSIIRGAFRPFAHEEGGEHSVELSEGFYQAIVRRPVPISEAAVRLLAEAPGALDAYLWLAYRLHVLEKPILVPWPSLHAQFGANTRLLKHFKPRFARDIRLAKSVYPEARIEWAEHGLGLQPSPPPIAPRPRRLASAKAGR
jgi:Plasmid encoded RepA protein